MLYCVYDWLKRNYSECRIKADLDVYLFEKYMVHSGFELTKVFDNIELDIATTEEILTCGGRYERHKSGAVDIVKKKYINHIRGVKTVNLDEWNRIKKTGVEELKNKSLWLYLDWNCVEDGVIPELHFANKLSGLNAELSINMKETNSVSVHVRRGDFIGTKYDIASKDYYINAMEWFRDRIGDPKFFVFSDDKGTAFEWFGGMKDCVIVDNNSGQNSYLDMQLMSDCKHNIICNSTFSIWGALLNKNPCRMIVVPKGFWGIPSSFSIPVLEM